MHKLLQKLDYLVSKIEDKLIKFRNTKHSLTIGLFVIFAVIQLLNDWILSGLSDSLALTMLPPPIWVLPFTFFQLITYQFAHAGWIHIMGNVSFMLPCSLFLENEIGKKKTLELFVISGIVAALFFLVYMPTPGLIGSSGSIFGLVTIAGIRLGKKFKELKWITMCFLVWFFCSELLLGIIGFVMALLGQPSGIAHFGHVGGMLGALLWMYYNSRD